MRFCGCPIRAGWARVGGRVAGGSSVSHGWSGVAGTRARVVRTKGGVAGAAVGVIGTGGYVVGTRICVADAGTGVAGAAAASAAATAG